MSEKLKNKIYRFLRTLPEFKSLSMDRQGQIIVELTKMITEQTENKQFITEKSWVDAAQWVVKNKQSAYVNLKTNEYGEKKKGKDWQLLDSFTANGLVNVYNNISKDMQKKFGNLNLPKAVDVMWSLTRKK